MRKRRSDGTFSKLDRKTIQQRVSHCGDFLYVGGYSGTEGYVDLKCNICGSEFRRSFVTIRHGKRITCATCVENRKAQREADHRATKEAERVAKAAERKAEREAKAKAKAEAKAEVLREQGRYVICKHCGNAFLTLNKRAITCSTECCHAYRSRRKDKRLEGVPKDYGVSLAQLVIRDNNRCWLCGELCDDQDYKADGRGSFIVGPKYPSIDHIVPLSKGGTHKWDNIALAHMICNSIKRDTIVRTAPMQKN